VLNNLQNFHCFISNIKGGGGGGGQGETTLKKMQIKKKQNYFILLLKKKYHKFLEINLEDSDLYQAPKIQKRQIKLLIAIIF